MSTSFYLVNTEEEKVKDCFNELVETEVIKLKEKLKKFNEENELNKEDEIEEKIRYIMFNLDSGIVEPEEILICHTTANNIHWEKTEQYENLKQFQGFYKTCQNKYTILDESRKEYTLEEFTEKISHKK